MFLDIKIIYGYYGREKGKVKIRGHVDYKIVLSQI